MTFVCKVLLIYIMDIDHAKYPTTCTHREPCTLFCLRHWNDKIFGLQTFLLQSIQLRIYCTHITIANRIIWSLYRYHTSVSIHCSHRIENMHTFWAYCVYHCKTYLFIVTYFILTQSQTQSIINRRYKS